MLRLLLLFVGLSMAVVQAQTPAITSPYVLGCINPAPAPVGKPTVFFTQCTTPAFLPLQTTSVIAIAGKTAPVWAHSYNWYQTNDPTARLVACPIGATVNAATCTYNGSDVSALVLQKSLASFKVTPPVPPPPVQNPPMPSGKVADYQVILTTAPTVPSMVVFRSLDATITQCFTVTNGIKTAQVCLGPVPE